MINAKIFMEKINEIEKRMDYVIENWESEEKITLQELRFVFLAYIHGLYKNKKIKSIARSYLNKIEEKRRLDTESLLTAIASALILKKNFSKYWNKLKEKIEITSSVEKSNIIKQLLTVLTPSSLKRIDDTQYIRTLSEVLKNQDLEKKLFFYWKAKYLFSETEKIIVNHNEIKHLREYLLWELSSLEGHINQKNKIRAKFIQEMLNYKVDKIDWIVFLIYHFLKKNEFIIITKSELEMEVKHRIKRAINGKVWKPLVCYSTFVIIKSFMIFKSCSAELFSEKEFFQVTFWQIVLLFLGTILLSLKEFFPSVKIPILRMTIGQVGELLMFASILWAAGLSHLLFNFL